jgi:hypothetical protein
MTSSRIHLSELTYMHIRLIGQSLAPYSLEFRGKLLCAVDPNRTVIIKGLLQFSGQKDNAGSVIAALNLIHNRAQVSSLGLRTGVAAISHFLRRELELPDDTLEIASTFICDGLQFPSISRSDAGQVLERFAYLCRTQPNVILDSLTKADAMVALDTKIEEAKS